MKKINIVIPCFNEEAVLPLLFDRLTRAAESWDLNWEVICVDDGSSDATWKLLTEQHRQDPRWKALSFSRNFGHQSALSAGLLHSTDADAVLLMDADLQDPPEELHRFIDTWKDGAEVVYAIREKRKEGPLKRLCYWGFYRLMRKLVSIEIPLDSGDFCLMDAKVVAVINNMPERNRFLRGLRAWSGFKQVGVPYERHSRAAGEAKYNFQKLIKLAADGIFNFSGLPLRLASHMGFWISLISLAGVIFTFLQRVFAEQFALIGLAPVPGFATIVIAILFLGGVQLICLGIVGEYLVRIFEEVKQRPPWIIRETQGIDDVKPT
ncbi:MAG: glycosyltransferase family 2 protein [Puniceicoccaceae bacterium]